MNANKERMRLWVAALRSGEFTQGRNALRRRVVDAAQPNADLGDPPATHDEFCCLGVACEVAIRNGLDVEVRPVLKDNDRYAYAWRDETPGYLHEEIGLLPPPVREWYGLDKTNPWLKFGPGDGMHATAANDIQHKNFDDIADAVERTFLR